MNRIRHFNLRWLWPTLALMLTLGIIAAFSHPTQASAPNLTVNTNNITHNIDENIYGVVDASADQVRMWNIPINRIGGNQMSRYNWQLDVWNPGHHWYFENINEPDPGTLPFGTAADRFVQTNIDNGADTLVQLALMGWTPKDRTETCGFHWDKYGWQTDTDWNFHWGCGNGVSGETGEYITWNDPEDTSYQVDENFARQWIQHLQGQYGNASQGGVRYYQLGNEPMIWHFNHRDVHKEWSSFDSVTAKGIAYGQMVKQTDPAAKVMGPGVWGWQPYYYSAVDIENFWISGTFPDRAAHGNMAFLEWYLQEMRKFEEQNGYRILDYIDIHAYPQIYSDSLPDTALALGPAGSDEDQARRLRSTRELWDPNWQPESWIPEPIYAIPLMHGWIDQHYPGTGVAITEYSWGANEHINGALAQADVFGIFARENVSVGTLFDPPDIGQPVDHAIRMFRNYDGLGSKFGDQYFSSTSGDEMQMSVFGSRRTRDGAITVMVINKTKNDLTSTLSLNGQSNVNANVFRYSGANLSGIQNIGSQFFDGSGNATMTFPSESISLFVIGGTTPPPTPSPSPSPSPTTPPPTATPSPGPTATPGPSPTPTTVPPTPSPTPPPNLTEKIFLPILNK